MIKEFNRSNVKDLMAEISEALRPIAEKHGLVLDRKGNSFRSSAMPVMLQLLVREEGEKGEALNAKAKEFKQRAHLVGLSPDDLGSVFTVRGKTFKITGLNLRARQFPILAEEVSSGKTFKFPVETVKRQKVA